MLKNEHGVEIKPVEERIDELRARIKDTLERLYECNGEDGEIGKTCVELAVLHGLFSRKHVLMKMQKGNKIDLDRFAGKVEKDALA